jgi:hypothetical protein
MFPEFTSVFATKNLTKLDVDTVLVNPITIENLKDRKTSDFYTDILINQLTKMDIRAVLVEPGKSLSYYKKKFNTSMVVDSTMIYEFVPQTSNAERASKSSAFVTGGLNLGMSDSNESGIFTAKGDYYKFSGATMKITNVDKYKIVFTDEITQQSKEINAIKRMCGHLAVYLSGGNVDIFKGIFLGGFSQVEAPIDTTITSEDEKENTGH